MDEVFDYASFMWDPSSSLWQQESPDMTTTIPLNANLMVGVLKSHLYTLKFPLPLMDFVKDHVTHGVR